MPSQSTQPAADAASAGVLSEFMTRDELAAELRVTVRTLARWRWGRHGPRCIRLGGRVFYRRADVKAWIETLADGAE